jgi:hypothetical protein
MLKEHIVREAYRAFGTFTRPEHFTDHTHCPECAEHDQTMRSRPLSGIGVVQLGNPGWSPVPFLTEQAYGYVMPRMIELAVSSSVERPAESFVFAYLLALTPAPEHRRLDYFTREQTAAVLQSLHHMRDQMMPVIEQQCCESDLAEAIEKWTKLHESHASR